MRMAIVDLGTNSVHLFIVELGRSGRVRVVRHECELVRLGEGGLVRGRLTQTAMRRTLAVLQRYAATLARLQIACVEAVATSAVRDAKNGRVFLRRARAATRLPLRGISGLEEARLIYLGIHQTRPSARRRAVITIGGGSAQVMTGCGARLQYRASVPLGGARLAQQFIQHDPPRPGEVEALTRHVRRVWAPVVRAVRRARWNEAVGGSATMGQVMLAASGLARPNKKSSTPPRSIGRLSLNRLIAWLARSTAARRRRLPAVDPRREALLLPTAVTLLAWMDGCGAATLRRVSGSLREGLVADRLIRYHQGKGR